MDSALPSNNNNSDVFDPTLHHNDKIDMVSKALSQKMQRERREKRKLESQIYCHPYIHFFGMCGIDHTLTAPFKCKPQHRSMVKCLHEYLEHDELDVYKPNFNRDAVFDDITKSASYITPEQYIEYQRSVEEYKKKFAPFNTDNAEPGMHQANS